MSDDLVSRLREPLSQLPGDDDTLMERVVSDRDEAAQALTEARAEIERLREAAKGQLVVVNTAIAERERAERNRDMWKGQCERQADQLTSLHAELDVANTNHRQMATHLAEMGRELSALRARVREVVGRIIAIENKEYGGDYDEIDEAREIARQLNEDLK